MYFDNNGQESSALNTSVHTVGKNGNAPKLGMISWMNSEAPTNLSKPMELAFQKQPGARNTEVCCIAFFSCSVAVTSSNKEKCPYEGKFKTFPFYIPGTKLILLLRATCGHFDRQMAVDGCGLVSVGLTFWPILLSIRLS